MADNSTLPWRQSAAVALGCDDQRYTIRVHVWPLREGLSGPWIVWDITVCADEDGEPMLRFKGEGEPDAVEECTP